MFFGEHAVIYDHPCLVTAVDQYLTLKANLSPENTVTIDAPQVNIHNYHHPLNQPINLDHIPKGVQFIEAAIHRFATIYPIDQGFHLTTQSEFRSTFGFGSSSAVTVCTIKALNEIFKASLSPKEVFNLAYHAVLDVQGVGSGFDIAAAVYGGTLYFATGGKVIETLNISPLPLVVGYTGIKADTTTLIQQVAQLKNHYPQRVNRIFNSISKLVASAKTALLKSDYPHSGRLMNQNQKLLTDLGVSTPELDKLILAARHAGAYGAKLSGAGGGDCMIALVSPDSRRSVARAITQAGGQIIHVHTHAPIK